MRHPIYATIFHGDTYDVILDLSYLRFHFIYRILILLTYGIQFYVFAKLIPTGTSLRHPIYATIFHGDTYDVILDLSYLRFHFIYRIMILLKYDIIIPPMIL